MSGETAEGDWLRIGTGVFQRRYEPMDVSVGAILGVHGVTIIDTRSSPE